MLTPPPKTPVTQSVQCQGFSKKCECRSIGIGLRQEVHIAQEGHVHTHTHTLIFVEYTHTFSHVEQASTISTGPTAKTQLLLARTGHKVFVRTTHCHIMLARTIIQRADLFPHCRDHFVRNATQLTHRIEFPCYVGDNPATHSVSPIPLVLI